MVASRLASRLAPVSFAVGLAMLTGCQPAPQPRPPAPPAPMVPSASQAMSTQQQFAALDPKAKVGRVAEVDSGMHMAAVSGINAADVKEHDTVSFADASNRVVANGQVISVDAHTNPAQPFVIVDYARAPSGGRDPVQGDLAIMVNLGH